MGIKKIIIEDKDIIENMSIDIYTLLEPRDNTPVRKRGNVCGSRDNEERLQN